MDWYPESTERLDARRQLGLGEDDFVYLHLGLMRPYKGVSDLLAAFARVGRPHDRLLVAGVFKDDDLWREAIEAAAADPRINIVNRRLADEELPIFFGAADVAVLPFRRATTSSSAILALGFGVPVVATAVGNVVDLLTPHCGILVAPRDPDELARALGEAHGLGPEARVAARTRAGEFTWQDAAKRIAQALGVHEPSTKGSARSEVQAQARPAPVASPLHVAVRSDAREPARARAPGVFRDPVVVVAAGGFRSGSTLQYNLIGEYVERLNVGRRIGIIRAPAVAALRDNWTIVESLGIAVAKTHEPPFTRLAASGTETAPQTPWQDLFRADRLIPLYSVRDWRDVAVSMCRKFQLNVRDLFCSEEWLENLESLDGWMSLRPLIQRYENLTGSPVDALRQAALRIGVEFVAEVAEEAVVASSLEAQRAVATELPTGAYDRRTLVHWDHIASPGGGTWRSWPPADQELLRQSLGALLERFGYQW
jgi:hypothetical protein